VFGDLLLDGMQLQMVSVAAALKEAGCEIEVNCNMEIMFCSFLVCFPLYFYNSVNYYFK
jgi:hypothetical protein